jgi:hypothetical protein
LNRQPGTTEGEAAHTALLLITTKLLQGFGVDEEDAVELLYDYCQQDCHLDRNGMYYPWTYAEVCHKVRDAARFTWDNPGDLYVSELEMVREEEAKKIIGV